MTDLVNRVAHAIWSDDKCQPIDSYELGSVDVSDYHGNARVAIAEVIDWLAAEARKELRLTTSMSGGDRMILEEYLAAKKAEVLT